MQQASSWNDLGDRAHLVQFYSDDAFLIDRLTTFVGTALVSGDAALVLATADHRTALLKSLRHRGVDPAIPRGQSRLLMLDAQSMLDRISVGGRPDPDRFQAVIGGTFAKLRRAHGVSRVAAFGEMVAIAWARGDMQTALVIEDLWNEALRTRNLTLCCAYPMRGFVGERYSVPFMKICARHSHVFAADPIHAADRSAPGRGL